MSVMSHDWERYYAATGDEPRETLLEALRLFGPGQGRLAVDLGSGGGRDSAELLRRGWRVVAVDPEPRATARLLARPEAATATLTVLEAGFEEADWPEASLVNSSFALPFCPPAHFSSVWAKIVSSLPADGRFSGQLFGERDQWAGEVLTHSRRELNELFEAFVLESLRESEEDGTTAFGEPKHWHVFHVVARKR